MTLHDQIIKILKNASKPLSIIKIANRLNQNKSNSPAVQNQFIGDEIRRLVKTNTKQFEYVNGLIFLTSDKKWISLLSSHRYLTNILRNYFSLSDLQFMLASLIFFKRIHDLENIYGDYVLKTGKDNRPSHFSVTGLDEFLQLIPDMEDLDAINKSPNIFVDCIQLFNRIEKEDQSDIFKTLERFDTSDYTEDEFGPIFQYFLHQLSIEFASNTTPYTPDYLQDLMGGLLAPESKMTIYDPVCGSGGLLIKALGLVKGELRTKGTEINHRIAQFAFMNLTMNGFFNSSLDHSDFLSELDNSETYDYIIADLPLNGTYKPYGYHQIFDRWRIRPPKSGKGYSAPVLFVLSKMSKNGKAVITVSDSLLFKGGKELEVRKLLIQEDVLECIVSLPNGALRPYTEAKASILILNRNKPVELRQKIKFIDSITTLNESKSITINTDEILSLYLSKDLEPSENYKIIDRERLSKDLNLSVSTYSTELLMAEEMLSKKDAFRLGEMVEIRSGESPRKGAEKSGPEIPFIKIENLSKDILDLNLDPSIIKNRATRHLQQKRAQISKESILIARIGDQLKPTLLRPSEEYPEVRLASGIFALIPKARTPKVDIEYLYYQLYSEFVTNQVNLNRMGTVMPSITIARLKKIIIPFMEISAQRQFVESQKANIIASERAKVEERIKVLNYREETEQKESDIVRTLVHQLRPTLASLKMQAETFERIAEKYNLYDIREFDDDSLQVEPDLKDLIEQPENHTFGELIQRIQSDTLHLSDALTSVKKVMNYNLDAMDKIQTDILQFIQEYSEQHLKIQPREYVIEIKGEHVFLSIHQPSFKELLDQLILNAEKHGFSDKDRPHKINRIRFYIRKRKNRPVVSIDYQNNGKLKKLRSHRTV